METETTDALLEDPGDLTEADAVPAVAYDDSDIVDDFIAAEPQPATDDDPVHLARCAECSHSVKFRTNVTGTGFFLVGADPDASYGAGAHGRPICPNGHGEMEIADDQLQPVPEAFANAQAMLAQADAEARANAPVQGDLPGILPAFNYQGCYLELEEKAAEVNALHEEYLERKEEAADAKKAWDKAAELYTKMALEFRRRRQAKGDDGPSLADPPSRALRCTWDKAHPDDRCPLCWPESGDVDPIVAVLGADIAAKDSHAHADQVVEYRTKLDVAATADALADVVYDIHPATIAEWTQEQRAAVRAWAANGNAPWDAMPAVLGRPHIAGKVDDDAQCCTECGAVLRIWNEGDGSSVWLAIGARVKTDCAGPQVEPEHHYPDTSKPKRQRKPKADATAEQKAEAAPRARAPKKSATPKHRSFPKPSAKKSGKGRR